MRHTLVALILFLTRPLPLWQPSSLPVKKPSDTAPLLETPGSVKADLHFALYCTPYYGYTPQSEADFVAMTFTLADFLVYTCFTTDSEPNAALSNLSVRPGDLLTILSAIHPTFLSVSPGDGMFILPLTTAKAALRPLSGSMALLGHRRRLPSPSILRFIGRCPGTRD